MQPSETVSRSYPDAIKSLIRSNPFMLYSTKETQKQNIFTFEDLYLKILQELNTQSYFSQDAHEFDEELFNSIVHPVLHRCKLPRFILESPFYVNFKTCVRTCFPNLLCSVAESVRQLPEELTAQGLNQIVVPLHYTITNGITEDHTGIVQCAANIVNEFNLYSLVALCLSAYLDERETAVMIWFMSGYKALCCGQYSFDVGDAGDGVNFSIQMKCDDDLVGSTYIPTMRLNGMLTSERVTVRKSGFKNTVVFEHGQMVSWKKLFDIMRND